jgi:hypothetical protein
VTDYHTDSKGDNQLINEVMEDDIKSTLLEPLYYTFKQKTFKFKGSKFGMLDDVTNQVRSLSGESVLHYILWSTMVALLLMEMIVFSPKLINRHNPNTENIRVNPAEVVEQIQKDVERTDSETDEEQADSQSDGEQKDAKSDTEKKKVE